MNFSPKPPTRTFLLLCCFTLCSISTAAGQSANLPPASTPIRGNPVPLFDGTTLDGWATRTGDASKNWVVDNGTIFRKSNGGDLYHSHWYRDFELTFEWKTVANGNSGVKYRVYQYGNAFLGCEYQLQDDKEGQLFDKHASGSIYALYPPNQTKSLRPVGEWNESKIVVCGHHIEHWLNGQKVTEATVGSSDWLARVKNSKFNVRENFGQNREGRIFLQDHGNNVWFRNIILVPLDCDNTARTTAGF